MLIIFMHGVLQWYFVANVAMLHMHASLLKAQQKWSFGVVNYPGIFVSLMGT